MLKMNILASFLVVILLSSCATYKTKSNLEIVNGFFKVGNYEAIYPQVFMVNKSWADHKEIKTILQRDEVKKSAVSYIKKRININSAFTSYKNRLVNRFGDLYGKGDEYRELQAFLDVHTNSISITNQ